MKIQSSLLVLAAMVGSATAANKRKRVFKIYSREEIQAAEQVTRSLQKDQGGKDKKEEEVAVAVAAPEVVMSVPTVDMVMSMPATEAPVVEEVAKCAFCDGVVVDPDLDLGVQGQTCGTVLMAASKLDATDASCALAKQAEFLCCPPVPATLPATTTAAATTTTTVMMSMPAAATEAAMSMPVVTETAMSMPTTPEAPTYPKPVYPGSGGEKDEEEVVGDKEVPPAAT